MDLKQFKESINDFKFNEIIPSMENQKIEMRPYVVRDQFKIAQAQMTEDYALIMQTLFDLVVEKCNLKPEIANRLTLVDVQYLLKRLKMISDDEFIQIKVTCPHCDYENDKIKIDLNKVEIVNYENFERVIHLSDNQAIHLRVPSFKKNEDILLGKETDLNSSMKKALINYIYAIIQDEECQTDFDPKELEDLVMNLPKKFLNEFNDFVKEEPTIKIPSESFYCAGCEKELEIGINHFFFLLV